MGIYSEYPTEQQGISNFQVNVNGKCCSFGVAVAVVVAVNLVIGNSLLDIGYSPFIPPPH